MAKIFISYRRAASSGQSGRLYDRLSNAFGKDSVFMDTHDIPAGETFDSYILHEIDKCDVFLAVLAEGTLDRIHNEDDWVRKEIAYALTKPYVRVIPVLVDNFPMPGPDKLPPDLSKLPSLNAVILMHQIFDASVQDIIRRINDATGKPHQTEVNWAKWGVILTGISIVVAALVALVVPFLEDALREKGGPSNTPDSALISSPTDTDEPTPFLTATSPPPSASTPSFPCDATVDPNSAPSTLNIVRQLPNPSASIVASLQRGELVRIIGQGGDPNIFYEIQSSGRTLGWVAERYLVLSDSCPN